MPMPTNPISSFADVTGTILDIQNPKGAKLDVNGDLLSDISVKGLNGTGIHLDNDPAGTDIGLHFTHPDGSNMWEIFVRTADKHLMFADQVNFLRMMKLVPGADGARMAGTAISQGLFFGYKSQDRMYHKFKYNKNTGKLDIFNVEVDTLDDLLCTIDKATGDIDIVKAGGDLLRQGKGLNIGVSMSNLTIQSIPNGAFITLNFDNEAWDTDNMHDDVTNNSRITIQTLGTYIIRFGFRFSINGTGKRSMYLYKNGILLDTFTILDSAPTGSYVSTMNNTALLNLVAGDYLELQVYQDSGAALNHESTMVQFAAQKLS